MRDEAKQLTLYLRATRFAGPIGVPALPYDLRWGQRSLNLAGTVMNAHVTRSSPRRGAAAPVDYRAIVESSGDLQIGEFARRVRRRRMLVGLAGVLLLVTASGAYWALRGQDEQPSPTAYRVKVHCGACELNEERLVSSRTSFPLRCTRCGEGLAQQVWTCRACGGEFEPRASAHFFECPACRSVRVGSPIQAEKP